jgi:large subunit ribosomal protein L15
MDLGCLENVKGSKKKAKRKGKGIGSGHGKTACRGQKGQKSRSGAKSRPWFEGGQMPLQRRIPKRGFTNIFRCKYQTVNLKDLNRINVDQVTPEILFKERIIRKKRALTKILGNGEMTKSLQIKAHAFSKSAIKKIEAAGGKAITL